MTFFGRLKQFFTRRTNLGVNDEKAWDVALWNLKGAQSLSGETVTEETALNYSAVYCAITLISGTIASLPLHLMQKRGKTTRIADDHPLYYVLHDRPNAYMTAMQLREVLCLYLLTWGNAFAEIVRNGFGDVYAIWPIPSKRVVRIDMQGDQLLYEIQVGAEKRFIPRERMLHISGLGWDGFLGYSPIAMARKSIGLGMAMETFGSRFFGSGTHPGVVVSHPNSLSSQAHDNLKKSLTETYSGLGQSHRLLLLEESMKIEKIGIPPEESQFLESRQFQIPEIARWFNLPPHKLKDLTKSSFSNIESEQISFVTDSILPWLIRIEQALKLQLLSPAQWQREKLYFRHNVEGLLRGNSKDRAEYYRLMIGNGVMTPNEAREKEDMNPAKDPLADELFMPTGLIPLSKFEAYLSKNAAGNTGAKAEATEEKEDEPEESRPVKALKLIGSGEQVSKC